MRIVTKIAATFGVIGAIAVGSVVPAAAWYGYGYHPHYYGYYYHPRYYGYYHHPHYYGYYYRPRYYGYRTWWGGY